VSENGDYLIRLAHTGTDPEWYDATESCGGCGNTDCHPGPCVGDYCRLCPQRKATGQVPW
jgi:hypothetical protein